jgi:hypothetical protein
VLAIAATTQIRFERTWLYRRYGVSRDCNRGGANQNGMPNDACRHQRVASKRHARSNGPHEPQGLQDVVSRRDVRNVAEWTHFRVEDVVPCENDYSSHIDIRIALRPRVCLCDRIDQNSLAAT